MKTRNQEVLLTKFIKLYNEKIDLNCPICKEILNEPVTLPCSHNFCKNCIETSIKVVCQQCPCCRKRFSYWYRHAVQNNKLVNENLWATIRENYGDLLVNPDKIDGNTQRFALSGKFLGLLCQNASLTCHDFPNFLVLSRIFVSKWRLVWQIYECPRPFVLLLYYTLLTRYVKNVNTHSFRTPAFDIS